MKRGLIPMLGSMLLLAVTHEPVAAGNDEPVYKGKPLRGWITALKNGDPRWSKEDVISILGEIGPDAREAVPLYIEALKDPRTRGAAVDTLGDIGPDARGSRAGTCRRPPRPG